MFENASESFLKANPQVKPWKRAISLHRRAMNKTEAEFALMLEAEMVRYEFEGLTLRWADMRYTPDFVVFVPVTEFIDETVYGDDPIITDRTRLEIKLIEVKGAHIWDRDIVRFKGARAYWPEFAFEMWQKTKAGWTLKF